MRSQFGLNILLVLLLSTVPISVVHLYTTDEDPSTTGAAKPGNTDLNNLGNEPATYNSHENSDVEDTANQEKRAFGEPSPASSPKVTVESGEPPQIQGPSNGPSESSGDETKTFPASTSRGFGTNLANMMRMTQGVDHAPQTQVPASDLPTIIEKDHPVQSQPPYSDIPASQTTISSPPAPQQSQTPSEVARSAETGKQVSQPTTATTLSSARTLDSWTSCVGTHSNKYGTCKNDVECSNHKGRPDGSCMGGFGVCCVMALSCGDKSFENNTLFANPDFPEPSWEARVCEVEVKKKMKNIVQIMIEFEEFELAPPNYDGECVTDVFLIKLGGNKHSPYSQLRICGENGGQHMYLDVSQIDEPIYLSIVTAGGGYPRRWSIRIVQMDEHNFLLAPPGCLQYYTDTVGHFRSFNLGKNLKHLYYAICFRIDNGYSGIRFTETFFGMNGLFCRKRPEGSISRYNGTYDAYPNYLVVPPPGYGRLPIRPIRPLLSPPLPYLTQLGPHIPPANLPPSYERGLSPKRNKRTTGWWPSWGSKSSEGKDSKKDKFHQHHEALFPLRRIPQLPPCELKYCGSNDVITFPPSGGSISEMCGNRFNRGSGPKIITGSPLVVYVSNKGATRGVGFDLNYEQIFHIPKY